MIYTDGVHLVADSLDELHSFAEKVGLKRHWFEGVRKGHPHYDVPDFLYANIIHSATVVSSKEILQKSFCLLHSHPENQTYFTEWDFVEKKMKTHKQIKCKGCGLYKIWIPKQQKKKKEPSL